MMFIKHPTDNQMYKNHNQLFEGLDHGDLKRLITPVLSIDQFKSKMGNDSDIIVLGFIVNGKEPARDLMSFIERGYDWVLDADISSGELDDGQYFVFVEFERSIEAPENINALVEDILNLTEQDIDEWTFEYRKDKRDKKISVNELANSMPLTPNAYRANFGSEEEDAALDAMQESARIPMNKQAPKNAWTESLRVAAGLK